MMMMIDKNLSSEVPSANDYNTMTNNNHENYDKNDKKNKHDNQSKRPGRQS